VSPASLGRPRGLSDAGGGGGRSRSNSASVNDDGGSGERKGPLPLYLSQPFIKAALVKGNFKTIVMLPKYCDVNEWVAINSKYFFSSHNFFSL